MHKIDATYHRWWVGKRCRRKFSDGPFRLVKDLMIYGPPSRFNCVVELVYEDDTRETVSMGVKSFRPCKSDVEVENS